MSILLGGTSSLVLPGAMPLCLYLPVFVPIFLLALAQDLSEVELMPVLPLKRLLVEIPLGLRQNPTKVFRFVASVGVGAALAGTGAFGLLHADLYEAVLANGSAGVLLGLSISRLERDLLLLNLIRLGQVRCLLVLRRTSEARRRLKVIARSPDFSRPDAVQYLATALWELQAGRPPCDYLHQATEAGERMPRFRDIWQASCQGTLALAGVEEPRKRRPSQELSRAPLADQLPVVRSGNGAIIEEAAAGLYGQGSKYSGIGRVLDTGYAQQKGMRKREYDPDNPTGYMTGQWIDVVVVEGVMEFGRFHSQGEVIRGVWSYGGDVGIVGRPRVGDLVGYYREGYCQIWEKLEERCDPQLTEAS